MDMAGGSLSGALQCASPDARDLSAYACIKLVPKAIAYEISGVHRHVRVVAAR